MSPQRLRPFAPMSVRPLPYDEPAPPRNRELGFAPAALAAHMQRQGLACAPPLSIRPFPSGFSNLTFRVSDAAGRAWVLRMPPRHDIPTAHDMQREYRILSHVQKGYERIPRPQLDCADAAVLGRPFYLMTYVRGAILRARPAPEGTPPPDAMRALSQAVVSNLAAIHALDLDAVGLAQWGRPQGYAERQLQGWARRYAAARTDASPDMNGVCRWLAERRPRSQAATLVHNDYKHDNIVLDPERPARILAVLDWEMATVGDPLMDLGTCLAYWVHQDDPPALRVLQHSPTHLPGTPSRRDVVEQYARESRRNVDDVVFYFVFGHMKLATILQQLHVRWLQGRTQAERYARLAAEVQACHWAATQAMQLNRIDDLCAA